ncbi:MAG: glycosyltransferase 87 family protein [Candidatus Limnocylindria bacterium]
MPERIARLIAIAAAALGAVLLIGAGFTPHVTPDADAYWHAAQRLREGLPLYAAASGDETQIYRYAPWFAYAWVPLTYLGQANAYLVWRGILLLAAAASVWPMLRRATPASLTLAVLMASLLVSNLPAANVTTLMVGALVVALRTRAGAIVIGLAASLKVFPLLLVAGYVAERRWREAAVAAGVASVLWLHVLAFGLSTYPTIVNGGSFYVGGTSLYSLTPVVWLGAAAAVLALIVVLAARGSPWTWLVSGAAIPTVVPRVWLPDAAYVLPAAEGVLGAADARTSGEDRPGVVP